MEKRQLREDSYLQALQQAQVTVIIRLLNDTHLRGQIKSFDPLAIVLKNDVYNGDQWIQKRAIATVKPARDEVAADSDGS